jgi:hypothetical protein
MLRALWKRLSQAAVRARILFDQCVPAPLRRLLGDHPVESASERGWATLRDQELLDCAEASGFGRFITSDRNLKYQQALSGRSIAILVLSTTSWPRIRQCVADVVQAVDDISAGDFRELRIQ